MNIIPKQEITLYALQLKQRSMWLGLRKKCGTGDMR